MKRGVLLKILGAALLIHFLSGVVMSEMSVEEAYQAIPHQRTVFDYHAANMPAEERDFLYSLFYYVDLAIADRVQMLLWLTGRPGGSIPLDYDELLRKLKALDVPPS